MSADPNSYVPDKRLRELVDAVCNESISEEAIKELENLISENEDAMDYYIQAMWLNDSVIRHSTNVDSTIDPAKFGLHELNQESNVENQNENTRMTTPVIRSAGWNETKSNLRESQGNHFLGMVASVAALFVITVGGLLLWQVVVEPGGGDRLAMVGENDRLSDSESEQKSTVASFRAEKVERNELGDGTVVIAKPGTKYSETGERELTLTTGELYLIVAKSSQPFVVNTPDGFAQAMGTRFNISAGDSTRTAVAQGRVNLTTEAGLVELGPGQEGVAEKNKQPIRRPAKRLSYLVNWAKDALKQGELLVEKVNTENGLIAIDPNGQKARLSLRKYHVDVYIEDGVARTTIDQTFFNHYPWNTEGTFYFPLPPDASVSRLAMYVFGELNEGGMVTRERGQEIYTDILYQRRDPALLEMMEGNMFKMRIFPLEGRQEKRIFLSYTQNLEQLYGATKYWFPMDHTNDVAGNLSIKVHIKDGAKDYEPQSSTHEMDVTTEGDDLVLEYSADKVKPDQDLLLNLLPKLDRGVQPDVVEVAVCERKGQKYLQASLAPNLGKAQHKPEPREWIVLNDVSASRSRVDVEAQHYILKRLLAEADDEDSIFLIDLNTQARNVTESPMFVRDKGVQRLYERNTLRLIGATNMQAGFQAVKDAVEKHRMKNPHLVYLGDGVSTDGNKDIEAMTDILPGKCKFVGVGVGKKVDTMFLKQAASATGGTFTNINPNEDIDWRVFDLVASLNTARMTRIKAELLDASGRRVDSIAYPNTNVLAAGETLSVTAMCSKNYPASIRFTGRLNNRPFSKTVDVKNAKKKADYIPRLWAKRHIDELLKSNMSDKEEIIALSRDFYVVTPFTSLIVLEDDAMYEEYKVERGRKDHWAKYGAPKTIEVVKEPVDWNRWGWHNFEGEDLKTKVTTKPKTVQEIIDNVQIRLNAPFYISQPRKDESRDILYGMANRPQEKGPALSRYMTLWYLLASGEGNAAADWIKTGVGNARPENQGGVIEDAKNLSKTEALVSQWFTVPQKSQQKMDDYILSPAYLMDSGRSFGFGAGRGFGGGGFGGGGGGRFGLSSLAAARQGIPFEAMDFEEEADEEFMPETLGFFGNIEGREQLKRRRLYNIQPKYRFDGEARQDWGIQPPTLQMDGVNPYYGFEGGLSPEMALPLGRAMRTRYTRINRDIEKHNRQNGYDWNGSWNSWDSIDLRRSSRYYYTEQAVEEIVAESFADDSGVEFERQLESRLVSDLDAISIVNERLVSSDFDGDGLEDLFEARNLSLLPRLVDEQMQMSSFYSIVGEKKKLASRSYLSQLNRPVDRLSIVASKPMRPRMFLSAARQPMSSQAGMSTVLAADILHTRLQQLKADGEKDSENERKAIETALSRVDRVGAKFEPMERFWGHSTWSYTPGANSDYYPPTIQAYPHFAWSFDLTRYANGLYSNSADMAQEVVDHYGESKPVGKIEDNVRQMIENSRSNFQPIAMQFGDNELFVGPNDRFERKRVSDMYLEERLVCDGEHVLKIYEEIGMVARRKASGTHLASLRKFVPHAIEDVDVLTRYMDVELVDSDDDSFTLKLTLAEGLKNASVENDEDEQAEDDQNDEDTSQADVEETTSYVTVKVDREGRVLQRKLVIGDRSLMTVDFDYEDSGKVAVRWSNKEGEELLKGSFEIRTLNAVEATFAFDNSEFATFDMPIKKPDYYLTKLHELTPDVDVEDNANIQTKLEKLKKATTEEVVDEAIRLRRHLLLSQLQDFQWRRWGGYNNSSTHTIFNQNIDLFRKFNRKATKGDVTLLGSAGVTGLSSYPNLQDYADTPVFSFFNLRQNAAKLFEKVQGEKGLVGHIGTFSASAYTSESKRFDHFFKQFPNSPLALALSVYRRNGAQIDNFIELHKQPRWEGLALLIGRNYCQNTEQQKKLCKAILDWGETLSEDEVLPILNRTIIGFCNGLDKERTQKMLDRHFEILKKLEAPALLMKFGELLTSSDANFRKKVYREIQKQMKMETMDDDTPLLKRFAFAQSLWASRQYGKAWEQYDQLLKQIEAKGIPRSPALTAAAARLAQQAGKLDVAIRLEEEAMAAEQPYLPDAINLNAFRQRYQWLWSQYEQQASSLSSKKGDEAETERQDLVERAKATWDRWKEVDRDNAALHQNMATLLTRLGRSDESWEYLSSIVDQKPKDAATYSQVGQWFRAQGADQDKALFWMKEAPQWDTANPQWIFQYAKMLKEYGKKREANKEFQKIVDGKWAPGLQQWVSRAQQEMQ